jgi:hypothetical protein
MHLHRRVRTQTHARPHTQVHTHSHSHSHLHTCTQEFWATGGRRVLWVSTSRDLAYDARRDLDDLDLGHVPVHPKV